MDFKVGLGNKATDLLLTLDKDGERRGLDAAHGGQLEASLTRVHGGQGPGAVDADEPVTLRAADGRGGKRLHLGVVAQMGKAILDRLLGHRLEPEALHRLGATGELDDVVKNQLTLATGVACVDDGGDLGLLEELLHDTETVGGAGDRLQLELLRNDRKGIQFPGETFAARHLVGKAEFHEMTHRRGDDVVVHLEKLGPGRLSTKGAGQIGGDAWLFGDDEGFGHEIVDGEIGGRGVNR